MPELFTLRINCIAFIIFTKHFTFLFAHGGLAPLPLINSAPVAPGGHAPVRGLAPPETKFLFNVTEHLGLNISDYMLVL